jgi:hypothetical protein
MMNMIAQKIQHWFLTSQSMLSNAPNITALVWISHQHGGFGWEAFADGRREGGQPINFCVCEAAMRSATRRSRNQF